MKLKPDNTQNKENPESDPFPETPQKKASLRNKKATPVSKVSLREAYSTPQKSSATQSKAHQLKQLLKHLFVYYCEYSTEKGTIFIKQSNFV